MWGAILGPAISLLGALIDRVAGQNFDGSSRMHTLDKMVPQVLGQAAGALVATAVEGNPLASIETGLPATADVLLKAAVLFVGNLLAGEATWRVGITRAVAKGGRRPSERKGLGRR